MYSRASTSFDFSFPEKWPWERYMLELVTDVKFSFVSHCSSFNLVKLNLYILVLYKMSNVHRSILDSMPIVWFSASTDVLNAPTNCIEWLRPATTNTDSGISTSRVTEASSKMWVVCIPKIFYSGCLGSVCIWIGKILHSFDLSHQPICLSFFAEYTVCDVR